MLPVPLPSLVFPVSHPASSHQAHLSLLHSGAILIIHFLLKKSLLDADSLTSYHVISNFLFLGKVTEWVVAL